jgi:hypothetical protein
MSKGADVLNHLRPQGGWVIYDNDFDSIIYDDEVMPVTEKEFNDTLEIIDEIKQQKEAVAATAKAALLEKLGITEEEAKLLLS